MTITSVAQNRKNSFSETDTLNKHFVRFLCMGDLNLGDPSISISMREIPPPSVLNEPVVTSVYCTERNQIVDTLTYLRVKGYILGHQNELKGDRPEQDKYGFLLIVDIDFKHRYFIQAKKAKYFITNLMKYLKVKGIADKING